MINYFYTLGAIVKSIAADTSKKSGFRRNSTQNLFLFQIIDSDGRELLLQAESQEEKNKWFQEVRRHIRFAV